MILEALAKYVPTFAIIAVALVGFGELKADVINLASMQQFQYETIQKQLDNINTRLDNIPV